MLNEAQSRNYSRCQKLHLYLGDNQPIYSTYVPFNKEAQSFASNFSLFQEYTTKKKTNGTVITLEQKELKNRLGTQVGDICAMATVYAEQYNNPTLAAAVAITKSTVMAHKDPDVYGLVQGVVNTLQPLLTDVHFMDFDITATMLDALMDDAATFRDNINKGSVIGAGGSIANQKINEVIKLLDKNVKTFDRLINKFSAAHPEFVAGYRINATLENPPARYTGIEGAVTSEATGAPVANALVSVKKRDKETTTGGDGSFSIVSMYGGDCEIVVSAAGFATKTITVHIPRGKIIKLPVTL